MKCLLNTKGEARIVTAIYVLAALFTIVYSAIYLNDYFNKHNPNKSQKTLSAKTNEPSNKQFSKPVDSTCNGKNTVSSNELSKHSSNKSKSSRKKYKPPVDEDLDIVPTPNNSDISGADIVPSPRNNSGPNSDYVSQFEFPETAGTGTDNTKESTSIIGDSNKQAGPTVGQPTIPW